MKSDFLSRAVLGIIFALSPGVLFGKAVYGTISGTVTDSSAAAIPKATVTVTDSAKGVQYVTTTNESGNYRQMHLIVSVYEVRVEAPGFQPWVQENVNVEGDAVTQVNAQLSVGTVGETVNVTADAAMLKTERAD